MVGERGERRNRPGVGADDGWDRWRGARPGCEHHGPGAKHFVVGLDLEASRCGAHRVHRRGGAQRRGGEAGVAGEGAHDAGGGQVAVGVIPGVVVAGQPGQPVGGEEPQAGPALGPPRVRHLTALDDDVVYGAFGEGAGHAKAGLAGADDDCRGLHHAGWLDRGRPDQASSTSTFVGLATTSKTAERFCDWAISASRSSREASASMANRTLISSKPLRTCGSAPRMPRMSIAPSIVAVTERSWMPRCWATAATPAVRHPARPTRTNSTGVAPLSSDAKHSGWPVPNHFVVRCCCSAPRPAKLATVEWLWVPLRQVQLARQVNCAASGAADSALRASSRAWTFTPLSTGRSVMVICVSF